MKKYIALGALLVVSGFFLLSAINMHSFGSPSEEDMDRYFIENAQEEASTNNVVTSIVTWRSHCAVHSGSGRLSALQEADKMMSKIVRTITNILYSSILIFGFYVIMHGHLTPGGGFQGGAVVASGIVFWRVLALSLLLESRS